MTAVYHWSSLLQRNYGLQELGETRLEAASRSPVARGRLRPSAVAEQLGTPRSRSDSTFQPGLASFTQARQNFVLSVRKPSCLAKLSTSWPSGSLRGLWSFMPRFFSDLQLALQVQRLRSHFLARRCRFVWPSLILQVFASQHSQPVVRTDFWNCSAGSSGHDLAVLIGNSRKLWQPFLTQWRMSKELQAGINPLETYLESQLLSVMNMEMEG